MVKKLGLFFSLFCLVFYSFSTTVFALTPEQKKLYDQDILYYDFACSDDTGAGSVSPGEGDSEGLVFPNLDPGSMAAAIDKFIDNTNPDSKMSGLGATIVAGAGNSNISPFLIVAHAHAESDMSDPDNFNVRNGNNSFGRSALPSQPHFSGARLWYKWSSVKASVDHTAPENQGAAGGGDIAAYIREQYPDDIDQGDLDRYLLNYVADGNEEWYGDLVRDDIRKMARASGGGGVSPVSVTEGCACPAVSGNGKLSSVVGEGMSKQDQFQSIVVAGADKSNLNPNYLAAFYFIENNGQVKSLSEGTWREPAPPYGDGPPWPTSSAGAQGPWQFIPSTWESYGVDGNNDGNKDINDLTDATFGAANYLAALGGTADATNQELEDAAFGYNHSDDYVDSIMKIYRELASGPSSIVSGSDGCPGGGSTGQFAWPDGDRKDPITTCFGAPRSYGGHSGIDIGSPEGESVFASDGGKIIQAGGDGLNGIIIEHDSGYKTRYIHNSEVLVNKGDEVSQGDEIAKVGSVGGGSTGPHIHFDIFKGEDVYADGAAENPLKYLPEDGRDLGGCSASDTR